MSAPGQLTRVSVAPKASGSPAGYEVVIGESHLALELSNLSVLLQRPPGRVVVVIDTGVPDAITDRVIESLHVGRWNVTTIQMKPSESVKTLATVRGLLLRMQQHKLERGEPIVAIGGGVVGDTVGYAASAYRRGVPVIQCPTTLLAMVDASVGGKTGVNLDVPNAANPDGPKLLMKNAIGAFHQPAAVFADVETLESLTDRDFRCGLAECYKHAMLASDWGDPDLLAWTRSQRAAIMGRDAETLAALVARSVALKARVVADDERETRPDGGRATLNLGHTFAHAIETIPGLTPDGDPQNAPLRHGEAVAIGLVAATATAVRAGLCDPVVLDHVRADLNAFELPTSVGGLPDHATLLQTMSHDKKAVGAAPRLILPTSLGSVRVVDTAPVEAIAAGWDAVRAG